MRGTPFGELIARLAETLPQLCFGGLVDVDLAPRGRDLAEALTGLLPLRALRELLRLLGERGLLGDSLRGARSLDFLLFLDALLAGTVERNQPGLQRLDVTDDVRL